MAIADFPGNLSIAIQEGYLKRAFELPLTAELGYRDSVDSEMFDTRIGQTITETRKGLLQASTTPLDPTTNTNLDNGLTPTNWQVEQYTLSINQYADTMDLNIVSDGVGIAGQAVENALNLGEQANRSLDLLARNTYLDNYMGGNTSVRVTLGAPNVNVEVDDIRGFEFVIPISGSSSGKQTPVSPSNPRNVTVGSNVYILNAVVADVTNVSSAIAVGGISGVLTFSATVLVADATAGNLVLAEFAPLIIRAGAAVVTADLSVSDIYTLRLLRQQITTLRNNAVKPFASGLYRNYIAPETLDQLYRDPEFQILFRGTEFGSQEYGNFMVSRTLGCELVITNVAPVQPLNGLLIQRPLMVGQRAVLEAVYSGMDAVLNDAYGNEVHDIQTTNDIKLVTRQPLDRLGQIIAQSWFFIGDWTAPTDQTANPTTIPTASDLYFKRAVFVETA